MANNYNQATITPELPATSFTDADLELLVLCGIQGEKDGSDLYLFAGESFNEECETEDGKTVNCVALLQEKLQLLDAKEYPCIMIEGAATCDKMRSGEFGGFAYFITRDEIRYLSTWQWLHEQSIQK